MQVAAADRLERLALEGLAVPALLCDARGRVWAVNGPAGTLLASWDAPPRLRPVGEMIGCANAREAGCGAGPDCRSCPLRLALRRALRGLPPTPTVAALALLREGRVRRVEVRIRADALRVEGARLAVLRLEPVFGQG